jgi:hypothetical protein
MQLLPPTDTCHSLRPGPDRNPDPRPARRFWHLVILALLLGWVVVGHGCHGDEDDEPGLFHHRHHEPANERMKDEG